MWSWVLGPLVAVGLMVASSTPVRAGALSKGLAAPVASALTPVSASPASSVAAPAASSPRPVEVALALPALVPPPLSFPEQVGRPADVSGVAEAGRDAIDPARAFARALLAPPRIFVETLFVAARLATSLMEQEQLVPRINAFMESREGEIAAFPTLFFDPNRKPSVGARAVLGARGLAADVRAGIGGVNEFVGEAKLRWATSKGLPMALALEALFDRRSDLQFFGVGQTPSLDERNRFRAATREARYLEDRSRLVLALGVRPTSFLELLLSTGLVRRLVRDSPDSSELAFSRVFEPGSVPGGPVGERPGSTTLLYSEAAVRADTRESRAVPRPGAFAEGWAGVGQGVLDDRTQYVRFGVRAAAFLPIVRKHNVLAPKVAVEQVKALSSAPIPFTELARQADFRGQNTRRDSLNLTASLDYRWRFAPEASARLFVDATTVGPELWRVGIPRFAGGFGLDVHASDSDVAQVAFSFSEEGVGFFLSFGVPSSFGSRQHRD